MNDTEQKTEQFVVRKHTAPMTGMCWFIVVDKETDLSITAPDGTQYWDDHDDAQYVADRYNDPMDELVKRVVETLPEKTDLVYVDYRDELNEEQIRWLLEGDMEKVWDSLSEFEFESQSYSIRHLWDEALKEFDSDITRDRLEEDDEAFERFREEAVDRDESDWFDQLLRQTGGVMIRYNLDHEVTDSLSMDTEEFMKEVEAIFKVTGLEDSEENTTAIESLIANASYGGILCILHRTDLNDVQKVDTWGRNEGGKVVFTDPNLLIYDGWNGSGHSETVKGTITVQIHEDTMRLDQGRMSWSDDIAGVVHSYYETPAQFFEKDDDK